MRASVVLVACGIAIAIASDARAQPYPDVTPIPTTTNAARMHAFASDREIVERIRRGVAALDRRDDAAASREFARVGTLHPHEPQASTALYDLGIALAHLGELDASVAAFSDAIVRDPGFLAARANLITVHLRRGDLPAARSAADALVAIAPESSRALYARGLVALRAGDAQTARADFSKLAASDPRYAIAHYDLALAEIKLADYAAAERELGIAIVLSPTYVRARLALGSVLLREGKRDDARANFDAAARIASDVALHNLAVSLRDAIVR